MHVYEGIGRRQVGGNLWSTIQRGIRPIVMNLISKLKPHAIRAGKKAAGSALTVGTTLAADALSGNVNKSKVKKAVKQEIDKLKNDALSKVSGFKRKYLDEQEGSGHKRRRISKRKSTMPKRRNFRKRTATKARKSKGKRKSVKKCRSTNRKSKNRINKGRINKKGRRRTTAKVFRDIFH